MSSARDLIGRFFAFSTLFSCYAAGLLGIVVVGAVGGPLTMGLRMMTGETEPNYPHLPWPFWTTVVLSLLPAPLLYQKKWKLAGFLAFPFALLPWWQLYCLYQLTMPS